MDTREIPGVCEKYQARIAELLSQFSEETGLEVDSVLAAPVRVYGERLPKLYRVVIDPRIVMPVAQW